jgi:uncharacterized membrane protein
MKPGRTRLGEKEFSMVPEIVGKFRLDVLTLLLPKLASYAIAFAFVGLSWIHHLLALRDVGKATLKLFWFNLLFLFCASLIPFTTAFLGDHPGLLFAVAMWGATAGLTAVAVHLVYNEAHRAALRALEPASKFLRYNLGCRLCCHSFLISVRSVALTVCGIRNNCASQSSCSAHLLEKTRSC